MISTIDRELQEEKERKSRREKDEPKGVSLGVEPSPTQNAYMRAEDETPAARRERRHSYRDEEERVDEISLRKSVAQQSASSRCDGFLSPDVLSCV